MNPQKFYFQPICEVESERVICSHFAYISVRLLSFCLHVSFCLQMCVISPTDGYGLERLSRDKTYFDLCQGRGVQQ